MSYFQSKIVPNLTLVQQVASCAVSVARSLNKTLI
jgi:hypothetical protein